jgi:hypothetical protein
MYMGVGLGVMAVNVWDPILVSLEADVCSEFLQILFKWQILIFPGLEIQSYIKKLSTNKYFLQYYFTQYFLNMLFLILDILTTREK